MQKSQDSQIKFAIVGTHSTGKTTFVNLLHDYLDEKEVHVNKLSELARDCPFQINENTSVKAQEWIISNQIIRENENRQFDVLITDRSVLDGYVYLVNFLNDDHDELFDKVITHLKTYNTLFVTKINPKEEIVHDGVRSTSKRFQQDIENTYNEKIDILDKHLKDNNINVVRVNSFNEIKEYVDNVLGI